MLHISVEVSSQPHGPYVSVGTCPPGGLPCPQLPLPALWQCQAGPEWEVALPVLCFPVLLLAYMKGNANLCRAIVRSGARLGVNNNQGVNIFNYQVATKQLLFRLLGEWPPFCSYNASTVTEGIMWLSW